MSRFKDITGQTFGGLKVIRYIRTNKYGTAIWECLCECGNTKAIMGASLRRGESQSCGCRKERCMGEAAVGKKTPEYRAYIQAKGRCNSLKSPDYKDYGGRGIQFLFASYKDFLDEVGRRPSSKHSLDRIDNDGNYEPGNLRWATAAEQMNNRQRCCSHCPLRKARERRLK